MERVVKKQTKRSGKSDLLCCRACLATEGKLVNMLEHKLAGEFFRISGITLQGKINLPHHLCVLCAALMQRCAAFRAKCLRATECLQACLLMGNFTTDAIGSIDRQANKLVGLSLTEMEVVDINGSDTAMEIVSVDRPDMSDVLDPISTVNLSDLQDDTDKPDVNNDLLIQIDSLNENEIKMDVVNENDIMEIKDENDDMFEIEYLEDIDASIAELESEVVFEPTNINVEKEVNIIKTKKRKAKKCVNKEVKNKRRKIKNDKDNAIDIEEEKKGKFTKKLRSAKDGFMPVVNLEKFKDACNVDIVILTREEQLAEIEARRASKYYINATYSCEPCGKYYRTEDAYNNHNKKHSKKKGPLECPVCKIRFRLQSVCWAHYDTHRFKFVCRQCGFVSRIRYQAKLHYQFHAGKKYKCNYCFKEFSKLSTYFGHVRLAHKTLNAACGMCGETFVNLRQHMASIHGVARKKQHMECKTCAVTFVSTDALQKHKMAAGEEHTKMSPCVQCGQNFTSEDAMKIHVDEEHPKCLDCNATFLNASCYDTHVDRKHRGIGDHIRQKYKNELARRRELGLPAPDQRQYGRGKFYGKPAKVVCHHCGKIFANSSLLRYHLDQVRGKKMKFACPHCPKSFWANVYYQMHLRVHTGEKPYECDDCGTAFTIKGNLRRHVLTVHLGTSKKSACDICGRLFTTPSSVKLHVRTVHNGEPWPKRAPREKKTKVVSESSRD